MASLAGLKQAGFTERYLARLPTELHMVVRDMPAGLWIAANVAEAHYEACDRMGLTSQETLAMGNRVGEATARVFMKLALRTAREAGATPWVVLVNSQRYWSRYYDGSAVSVTKTGPKEGRLEVGASSLARCAYWRAAFGAILAALAAPFCTKAYVSERPQPSRTGALYRIAWA